MKTHVCGFCGTVYEVHPGMNSCPGMEGMCASEWYEPIEEIRPCNCSSGNIVRKIHLIEDRTMEQEFYTSFGRSIESFRDNLMSLVSHRFVFDIVAFDKYCHDYLGYVEEEHGSLQDFMLTKCSKELVEYIRGLL